MDNLSSLFSEAVRHHTAGELGIAERKYRSILQVDPQHADALHLLGVIGYQAGHYPAALELIGRAIALRPEAAPFHSNFGLTAQALRRFDEAVAAFSRAVELQPQTAEMHYNLANGLKGLARVDAAVACYRRALELKPGHFEAHNNLGNTLRDLSQLDEAEASIRKAVQLKPDSAEFHNNLATVLRDLGRLDEAVASCRRALELKPAFAAALNNLGNALSAQKQTDEAIACYRQAITLEPDFSEGYGNLGDALLSQGWLIEALNCFRRVIELTPDSDKAHNRLANALMIQGQHAAAELHYRRALELDSSAADVRSSALYWSYYRPGVTPADLALSHAEWNRLHALPVPTSTTPRTSTPDGERKLRLGFVSADFGRHPVGYFAVRPLEALDRNACEIVCYSTQFRKDDLTQRIRAASHLWREVKLLSDDAFASQIREDGIDILIDLSGHSGGNRLPVFARKPAPMQMTWIGSEGTTGLDAMDYLLADRHLVPPGAEEHYRETVLYMPESYLCYDPPAHAPPVGPLPAHSRGRITFGSFNNLGKLNAAVLDVWATILQRVPESRLALKYRWLNDPAVQQQLADSFAAHGIARSRLEFSGWCSHDEMLACYNAVDIALDPFPFAGGVTTCEALWMGVPVITLPGETFAGRHSLSYLANVGLTELVAGSVDEYIEIATRLAGDLPRLSQMRETLREQVAKSPLCNAERFAAQLLDVLRQAWRTEIAKLQGPLSACE